MKLAKVAAQQGMKVVIVLTVVTLSCGCQNSRPTHLNASLGLNPRELLYLTADVNEGVAHAAWRIFLHYEMYAQNPPEADKWLSKAAELGYTGAQKLLADRKKINRPAATSRPLPAPAP